MQDRKQRGSNDLEVIIHDLKKEREKHQDNYDELDY